MEEAIRLECFSSRQNITTKQFYVYTLKVLQAPPDLQADSLLNSAVRRLNKQFTARGYFAVRKQERIYTAKEIVPEERHYKGNDENSFSYELLPQGAEEVPLTEHLIYESYCRQLIERNLLATGKYQWSPRNYLVSLVEKSPRTGIYLLREYHFDVEITADGRIYLYLDTFSRFDTDMTVYQQIKNCRKQRDKLLALRDEFVTYNLNTSYTQSGHLVSLKQGSSFCTRESLVNYYKQNYPQPAIQAKIATIPADDRVVQVKLKNKNKTLSYLASLLKPVLTTETVAKRDKAFFFAVQGKIKRSMKKRLQLDQQVLADIDTLAELDGVTFFPEPVSASKRQFTACQFALPTLIAGKNFHLPANDHAKQAIFKTNIGYYRAPKLRNAQLKIKFINQTPQKDFPVHNFFVNLMDLALKYTIKASFDKISLKFCQEGEDIRLVLIPNRYDNYSNLKKDYAEKPVPSQMITLTQAEKILRKEQFANNVAQNIAMGILGKLGGIPFILEQIPGAEESDLFVGLDVGMQAPKVHYPACSVVLDGRGEFLGCYEPKNAQRGEKIDNEHLRELFDAILSAYQQKYQQMPRHLTIHRDGFSQEDNAWYQNYFHERNIRYAILEIRKSGAPRLANLDDDFFNNPKLGTALVRGDEGILITSQAMKNVGAPQPLHVFKKCGDVDMQTALEQIYCLTKIHTGSLHNLRLPVTTYYADQICKSLDFLPKGQLLDKLYFL